MRKFAKIALTGASLIGLMHSAQAMAQDTPPPADQTPADDGADAGITVVGSLIRGTTVTGSQTLSVGAEAIADKMPSSTNELLSLIPQISNTFNGRFEGDPRGTNAGISITKPNLRGLPGANSSSGGTTLVILDGFRFTPVGVNQSSIDVDIIPAAVIAGVDAITDGGSSLYGADAVAGVINFRTMRKFEGVKIDANYGFGTTLKHFDQWDAQLTAGASWSTGNAYISGGYSHRDLVLNNETTWSTGEIYSAAGVPRFTGTQCNSPVGTETRWFRFNGTATGFTSNPAAPGAGTFAVGTACDNVGQNTYLPEQTRYNVFAQATNEFSDSVSLRVIGYWTKRDTELGIFPRGVTSAGSGITTAAQLTAAFPAALATAVGSTFAVTEGVGFSLAPNAAYVNTPNKVGFETWGVTPELTVKLPADWQVRATAHFGRSFNYQSFPGVNTVKAQCYITGCTAATSPTGAAIAAGQLNPLNVAAASAAVIQDITNYYNDQDTKQQLFVARVVADGPLFALPGGDAKLAIGAEYQDNKAEARLGAVALNGLDALPYMSYSRHAKSAFAEIQLPVIDFFTLSGSIRYDDYSDFGSTTNPNIGATFTPTDWLKIYGHWNKSFNAPTAVDGLGIGVGRFAAAYSTAPGGARPNDPYTPKKDNGAGTQALVLEGVRAGIGPQTAESWAVGFEATPLDGLRFGGEFYSIDFDNILGAVNPQNLNTYITNPELYIYNASLIAAPPTGSNCPTGSTTLYACILSQLTNGAALGAQQAAGNVALVVDRRTSNIGSAQLEGVDFHIYYNHSVGDGDLSLGLAGTKTTKSRANFGTPTNELGNLGAEFSFTTFAGYKINGFSSRVTVNYSGMYHDAAPNISGFIGTIINPFTVVNLNFGYEFDDSAGALAGTSLRLAIDNVLQELPQVTPHAQANLVSYQNWTLGRVIKLGVSKKF